MKRLWKVAISTVLALTFLALLMDGLAHAQDQTVTFTEQTDYFPNPEIGMTKKGVDGDDPQNEVNVLADGDSYCVGGTNNGNSCTSNSNCPDGGTCTACAPGEYCNAGNHYGPRRVMYWRYKLPNTSAALGYPCNNLTQNCASSGYLSGSSLDVLDKGLAKAFNAGMKVELRFRYGSTDDSSDMATKALTLNHITTITNSGVLTKWGHVLTAVQGGFMGKYGEWHNACVVGTNDDVHTCELQCNECRSSYNTPKYGCTDTNAIQNAVRTMVPPHLRIGFRHPDVELCFGSQTAANRNSPVYPGMTYEYCDGQFAGPGLGHMINVCANWPRNDTWLRAQTQYGMFAGEPTSQAIATELRKACVKGTVANTPSYSGAPECAGGTGSGFKTCNNNGDCGATFICVDHLKCNAVKAAAARYYFTISDEGTGWPGGKFTWSEVNSDGCFSTITKKMGYRLVLTSATIPASRAQGASFPLTVNFRNDGYGKGYNPRTFYLELKQQGGNGFARFPITSFDWRTVGTNGATGAINQTFTVPANLAEGTYDVFIWAPDNSPKLRLPGTDGGTLTGTNAVRNAARYSVRLSGKIGGVDIWNSTTARNKIGSMVVGAGGPDPDCTTNADCEEKPTDNPCTTDTCEEIVDAFPTIAGRIAISQDGNQHDCDDIAGAAVSAGMIAKTGNSDRVTYWGYADHHWYSNGTCGPYSGGAARRAGLEDSTYEIALDWNAVTTNDYVVTGGTQSKGVFLDCNGGFGPDNSCGTACQQCVDALELEIEASTSPDPLIIIEGGPADIIGRALDEAGCDGTPIAACAFVEVLSHNTGFNDIHSDNPFAPNENPLHTGWTWAEMEAAFPTVTFTHIPDQNNELNGPSTFSQYYVWRDSSDAKLVAIYDQLVAAGKSTADISDAGMTWWVIQDKPTKTKPTVADIKTVFATESNEVVQCSRTNNTDSCSDGLFCTDADVCGGGACIADTDSPCSGGTPICNEDTNACEAVPGGGITLVTPAVTACEATPGNTLTIADVPIGTEANRILLAFAGCEENDADCDIGAVTATFAGQPMQRAVANVSKLTSWRMSSGIFYLLNPPTGSTDDVTFTYPVANGGDVNVRMGAALYAHSAMQIAPLFINTKSAIPGGIFPPQISLNTSAATDPVLVVDALATGTNTTISVDTGGEQTERFDIACGATGASLGGGSFKTTPVDASVQFNWATGVTIDHFSHSILGLLEFSVTTTTTTLIPPTTTLTTTTTLTPTTTLPPGTNCEDLDETDLTCAGGPDVGTTCTTNGDCTGSICRNCNGVCPSGLQCADVGATCGCANPTIGCASILEDCIP